MVIKLELTKDHLKLIPFFFIQELDDDKIGVDKNIMFNMGSHLLEDMAIILGLEHKAIKNSQFDAEGRAFDDETEKYMLSLYDFFNDNFYFIETLIHQYIIKGGLKVGTYIAFDNELIWKMEGEKE
jgi:hypothetical protein